MKNKIKNLWKLKKIWAFRVVFFLCFLAVMFYIQTPVHAENYRTIKVGYYQAAGFQEGDNNTTMRSGYGYEYLQKIASYTGWKYEYIEGTWEELYEKLEKGEIDLMAGIAYDEDRSNAVLYPDYEMLKETFYIYKDSNDSSMQSGTISSFSGKKIGVVDDEKMKKCLDAWKQESGADITVVDFKDLMSCAEAFNEHQIDGFVSADNIVSGYTGISPTELIGKVPYYLCVAKGENDILEKVNKALSLINGQDSAFLSNLKNKYSADTSISIFLTKEEKDWMNSHPTLTVGYLKHYLPYSDTTKDGSAQGVLVDALTDLFDRLPGTYEPEISYVSYENHEDMIQALKNNEVDLVFPVGGSLPYAEQSGYQQSSVLMQVAVDLVYMGQYNPDKLNRIAVNKNNILQIEFTEIQYPESEIIMCESAEDCVRAVKNGTADSSLIEAIRAVKLVGDDKKLQIAPLSASCDICFGANYGNSDLLCVLNHGLSMLGEEYGISHAYTYMGDITSYDVNDFLKKNIWFVYGLGFIFIAMIIISIYIRYRAAKKISEAETNHNYILQKALMKAHEASYAKQIFLNNLSHDIRTPLNAILGIVEVNQKCTDQEIIRENRQKAANCVNQLLGMLENMLEMNQLENGQILDMNENVDLHQIINSLDRNIKRQAEEKQIKCVHDSPEKFKTCPAVYGNVSCTQEILQHILNNAIKYNHPGGMIHWKDELSYLSEDKVEYRCTISDTGIGMKEEFLKHIFEPFAQERYDARTTYKGAGLGMAIVKMLLDQMNGTITIDSMEEKGTTVTVKIPFNISKESEKQPEEKVENIQLLEEETPDLSRTNILLVEDNELNIEIAQFMLEDAGAKVTVAKNGEQAVRTYLESDCGYFDAILMDIMMPIMNGYEATVIIRNAGREDSETIPIIATTACVTDEARKEVEASGFSAFLAKPLDLNKVLQLLHQLIGDVLDK